MPKARTKIIPDQLVVQATATGNVVTLMIRKAGGQAENTARTGSRVNPARMRALPTLADPITAQRVASNINRMLELSGPMTIESLLLKALIGG